jgi:membrane fusion protein, macrolide-specific efflux system
MKKIFAPIHWFLKSSIWIKIIVIVIIGGALWFSYPMVFPAKTTSTQYQTSTAEKGTLSIVVTASGQVNQTNSATVSTQASGVVNKIYVENGQVVKTGDKIAEIDLDLIGKQRSAAAWSSYQSAKINLDNANIAYYSLQTDLLNNWKAYMDIAQSSNYQNTDLSPRYDMRGLPQYVTVQNSWLSSEAKYKEQAAVLAQSQTSLSNAWLNYQQTSSTVYAPISGTVTGLGLQIGSVLTAQSNTSGTSTAQKIASVQTDASPIIQVNLTQIDTPKVKVGNKATLTFDAFPGKTYTGKVVSIDTIGAVSSGVTTYPAIIQLDTKVPEIYSNMTASANIITQVKNDVLMVPNAAVSAQTDGTQTVRILKNGQVNSVTVETGIASSTQTEIVSGVSEGDAVVTSNAAAASTRSTTGQTTSPFGGGFGGGGAVFRRGG